MPIPEIMQPVASTNITAVGYDAENLTVYIQFLDGSAYARQRCSGARIREFENRPVSGLLLQQELQKRLSL